MQVPASDAGTGASAAGAPGAPGAPGARPARVVAVLVCHDGAQWLPRTLAALAGSTRRPDLVVAVDAGSTDRTAVVLDTALGTAPGHVVDAVVTGGARDGFGVSVQRGLAAADRLRREGLDLREPGQPDGDGGAEGPATGEEWVWLLHDDSAPDPGALAELLSVVRSSPTLAVAGCKQRGWDDVRTLVEVGATVSRGGRRLTDLGVDDLDQGQHDDRGDVLLVSTAGMLLRRTVLDHVGGFDPAVPLVGDDVDLCLRVRRAGHRVAVVPTAVVRHVAALERGARPADALHGPLARRLGVPASRAGRGAGLEGARRRHWLHARLVQAPAPVVPLLWLWILVVTPVRALVWLLRGRPARAGAELAATGRLLVSGWRVGGSRWRSRRARAVPAATVRSMQRSRARVVREDVDAWRAGRSLRRRQQADDDTVPLEALESGPVDDETIDLDLGAGGLARRLLGHPVTYLLPLTLLVGALPVLRAAVQPGPVDADGIAVAVEDPTAGLTAVELWSRASTGWRDVGTGVLGAADPATTVWAGLSGLVSLVGRGSLSATTLGDARTVLLLLAPALALVLAYPVARGLLRRRAAAAGAATVWALLPQTGLLGEVHVGDLLVHALLPALLAATLGCLGRRPVNSLAATGLLGGVVVALAPGTWPVLLLLAVLVGVVGGSWAFASWRAALPLVGVAAPALLWAGWVAPLRRDPRALLLDPSSTDPTLVPVPTAAGLVDLALRSRDVLAGRTGVLEDPRAVLAGAALVLLATAGVLAGLLVVAALARTRVPAAWCALATAGVAAAIGVAAVLTARVTGTEPSAPTSAAALGLGTAALLGLRDVRDRAAVRGVLGVLAAASRSAAATGRALLPLTAVVVAVAVGTLVPAAPVPAGLPSPALVGSGSAQATRTLLLGELTGVGSRGADAVLVWSLASGQPGPGQASVQDVLATPDRPVRAADRRLADTVASALGDGSVPGADVSGALAELGVGWVVVADRPDVDTALAQRAGLVRTAQGAQRTTWRVDSADAGSGPIPARARLESAAGEDLGAVDLRDGEVEVPAGEPGRLLVLAETARSSWSADLDGADLSRTTVDGWAQGFLLPADGGTLRLIRPGLPPAWSVVAPVALLMLLLGLVWPGRRHRVRLDRDRVLAARAVPRSRAGRSLRVAGRVALAGVATAVVLGLLVGASGVGVGTGALRVQRLLTDPGAGAAGAAVAGPVEALLDRVPPPDPVAAAPVVRLAGAGSLQTCTAPGPLDTGVSAFDLDVPAGADARGLTTTTVRTGDDRALRVAACPQTATSSWVLLGGTGVGEEPRLLLANPGETGAVVDVRLGGGDGVLDTPASTGILVAPGEQAEVAVDALAPDQSAVLARVVARVGTVAVSGSGSALSGLVPLGGDDQPAQTSPSTSLVLPWVRIGPRGQARLLVGSVGPTPAVVRVRVVPADPGDPAVTGSAGEVPGAPTAPVVAPAGGVVDVDLSGLPAGGYALHLQADVPVVASWTGSAQRDGEPAEGLTGVPSDRSWVQALPSARPWRSTVVLPVRALLVEAGGAEGTTLGLVAAGPGAGRARVAVLDPAGEELASRPVDLPAAGAPAGVTLARLLQGLDPARVASLAISSATGVHLGLAAELPDADGPLVAGTSVPGPQPPTSQVRLVRD